MDSENNIEEMYGDIIEIDYSIGDMDDDVQEMDDKVGIIRVPNGDYNLVVKANTLIEARYELGALEQKMLLYTISKLNTRSTTDIGEVSINTADFIEKLGVSGANRHSELRSIAKSLTTRSVEILKPSGGWVVTTWLAAAEYEPGKAVITMRFDKSLVPYLYRMQGMFTSYELQNVITLSSKYSIRLYELLKQYQKIGSRTFSVEQLRLYLGTGKSYEKPYDLESRIIDKSLAEINELTDLNITYEKIKEKRTTIGYLFSIDSKDKSRLIWIKYLEEYHDVRRIQTEMGLDHMTMTAEAVISFFNIALSVTESRELDPYLYSRLNVKYVMDREHTIPNLYGYIKGALAKDYANAVLIMSLQKNPNFLDNI